MSNPLNDKQKRCIEIFEKKVCNVSETCKALKMSRETFYKWKNNNDTFKKEIEAVQENFYDTLESKIYKKAIVDEETTMLIFLAKTKMKSRGYIESSDIHVNSDFIKTFEIYPASEKKNKH